MSKLPRLAENESDLWKAITNVCEKGVVCNYRILYPIVRVFGSGDYRVTMNSIEKIEFHGVGTCKDATNDQIRDLEYAINTDTAMVIVQSHWGYSGNPKTGKPKDLKVLHYPHGNSYK